ncbi:fungal hydrophobin [Cristinia sonorae]|uniref:Hydrophobin n=1 Tax=Cristinia sonorae TaxID=1940300 RepID=A0A8K0XS56_9AGAR|nr:fungal hydrophobin [Cristinia sonorae]
MKFAATTAATMLSSFALLAVASPWADTYPTVTVTVTATAPPATAPTTVSQCNTGDPVCCDSVTSSESAAGLLGLLGIVLGPVDGLLGIQCSPILGGGSCNAHPVCCSGNTAAGGLINIGCLPIVL